MSTTGRLDPVLGGDFTATLDLTSLGMVDDMVTKIEDLGLSTGTETTLTARLEAAVKLLGMEVTNDMGVLALLDAFIAGANRAFDRGEISLDVRNDLIDDADLIMLGITSMSG